MTATHSGVPASSLLCPHHSSSQGCPLLGLSSLLLFPPVPTGATGTVKGLFSAQGSSRLRRCWRRRPDRKGVWCPWLLADASWTCSTPWLLWDFISSRTGQDQPPPAKSLPPTVVLVARALQWAKQKSGCWGPVETQDSALTLGRHRQQADSGGSSRTTRSKTAWAAE